MLEIKQLVGNDDILPQLKKKGYNMSQLWQKKHIDKHLIVSNKNNEVLK